MALKIDELNMVSAKYARQFQKDWSQEEKDFVKNADMVERVEMRCKKCGGIVKYEIKKACPSCGLIYIGCEECGYEYFFGE